MQFIRENPELLRTFAANLLPQMLQVYNGSVVSQVRLLIVRLLSDCAALSVPPCTQHGSLAFQSSLLEGGAGVTASNGQNMPAHEALQPQQS